MSQCITHKNKGQAALILVLLSAVALIFFAITLNLGRVSQVKTQTMVAATTAAASTASNYASYGEREIQTTLGGFIEICKHTSVLVAIITLIIIIVITICTCGVGAAFSAMLGGSLFTAAGAMAVAIVLSAATLVMQVTIVQPGLTKLWNKMQNGLPVTEQFLEQSLSSAAQGIVTDQALIGDYFDMNTNGKWGLNADGSPKDKLSRYGFYYAERLKALKPKNLNNLGQFIAGLRSFTENGGGLNTTMTACEDDPRCNPCCLPLTDSDGTRVRPGGTCSESAVPPECGDTSKWPYSPRFPFSYDPSYTDVNGSSFLSRMGLDAEVRDINKEFKKEDASGLFSYLWDMDQLETEPNRMPSNNDATNPASMDARVSDHVTKMQNFQTPENVCANINNPLQGFFWKKGTDRYCNELSWPYDKCDKYSETCEDMTCASCKAPEARQWPEDPLDDLVYTLREFSIWSKNLITAYDQDPAQLEMRLDEWYPEAAMWVGDSCNGSNGLTCYDGGMTGEGGILPTFIDRMDNWGGLLDRWLRSTDYHSADAWCLPNSDSDIPTQKEKDAIAVGGAWGTLDATIACLNYNKDNAASFAACGASMDALSCATPSCAGSFNPCKPAEKQVVIDALNTNITIYGGQINGYNTFIGNLGTQIQGLNAEITTLRSQLVVGTEANPLTPAQIAANATIQTQIDGKLGQIVGLNSQITAAQSSKSTVEGMLTGVVNCKNSVNSTGCPSMPETCSDAPRSLVPGTVPSWDPCDAPSQYRAWVTKSQTLAAPQGVKFTARKQYLEGMKTKAEAARDAFVQGKAALDDFINNKVGYLTAAREKYTQEMDKLPKFLVYGWQNEEKPKNGTRQKGYWHIVQIVSELPGRCPSGLCGPAKGLPAVKTKTKGFLKSTRCYYMEDSSQSGKAMVKVTRWDEDHDGNVQFANKKPLWKFVAQRPGRDNTTFDPKNLSKFCSIDPTTNQWRGIGVGSTVGELTRLWGRDPKTRDNLTSAFMINVVDDKSKQCWDLVQGLLQGGVSSQVCAQYSADKNTKHMKLNFTSCGGNINAND